MKKDIAVTPRIRIPNHDKLTAVRESNRWQPIVGSATVLVHLNIVAAWVAVRVEALHKYIVIAVSKIAPCYNRIAIFVCRSLDKIAGISIRRVDCKIFSNWHAAFIEALHKNIALGAESPVEPGYGEITVASDSNLWSKAVHRTVNIVYFEITTKRRPIAGEALCINAWAAVARVLPGHHEIATCIRSHTWYCLSSATDIFVNLEIVNDNISGLGY